MGALHLLQLALVLWFFNLPHWVQKLPVSTAIGTSFMFPRWLTMLRASEGGASVIQIPTFFMMGNTTGIADLYDIVRIYFSFAKWTDLFIFFHNCLQNIVSRSLPPRWRIIRLNCLKLKLVILLIFPNNKKLFDYSLSVYIIINCILEYGPIPRFRKVTSIADEIWGINEGRLLMIK